MTTTPADPDNLPEPETYPTNQPHDDTLQDDVEDES